MFRFYPESLIISPTASLALSRISLPVIQYSHDDISFAAMSRVQYSNYSLVNNSNFTPVQSHAFTIVHTKNNTASVSLVFLPIQGPLLGYSMFLSCNIFEMMWSSQCLVCSAGIIPLNFNRRSRFIDCFLSRRPLLGPSMFAR